MPKLKIEASGFTVNTKSYNKTQTLDITKRRCMKFVTTMGMPILQAGTIQDAHAITMALYKSLALKAAIDFTGTQLAKPSRYKQLDATEKSNISFWTGMTFAAIAADEILKIPRLLHAASMLRQKKLVKTNSKSRSMADLIGADGNGDWHIIEAKARQQNPSAKTRTDWKTQAGTVALVQGKTPITNSYCYTKVGDIYSVELVDPPSRDATLTLSSRNVNRDVVDFYYGALRGTLRNSNLIVQRDGRNILLVLAAFDLADNEYVFLGMDEDSFISVSDNAPPEVIRPYDGPDCYLGSDGIALITSPNPIPEKVERDAHH